MTADVHKAITHAVPEGGFRPVCQRTFMEISDMLQRRKTSKVTIAAAVGVGGLGIWLTFGPALAGAQSEVDSQFAMAGINNPKDARSFLEHLKMAEQNEDHDALAALVHYPLAMYDNGKVIKIYRSRNALLKNFNAIFTPKVLKAIRDAKFETLFVRDQGAMIGDGEIWFVGWNGQVLIKTINP
ncbi:MAG: hypothetical protein ACREC0_13385 [Methylocella sp.]